MRSFWGLLVLVLACAAPAVAATTSSGNDPLAALQFRNIGPLPGRIDAVAGVAGDPYTYYAGGLGGLFKSSDGAITWTSIFNNQPVSSIGAISVARSQPQTVYVGTGEANLRNDVAFGDGVWRSNDGGTTWAHTGLDATGAINQIAIDPKNANRAFIAAVGDVYKATADRGVYRTLDGGATWSKVLYTDDRTGANSVAIDPLNPGVIYAGMWEGGRTPFHLTSGGAADGIYRSVDGGDHWTRLQGNGLPTGVTGRIAIAFAPSNPRRIYALIESAQGSLWRSDDSGATWKMVNASHGINQRPFYFTSLAVDPKDENLVYFMSVQMWQSTDGGATAKTMKGTRGGDYHELWIDPENPSRMAAADDGGAEISTSAGKTWHNAPIIASQQYHLDVDDRVPYTVCAEDQDTGSACGPSDSLNGRGISPDEFFSAGGGESGWMLFDGADSNVIYGDGYQGSITRYDRTTTQAREIGVWPQDAMGWNAAPLKYRFQWTSPLAISPQHPHRLYMGGNKIFQTDDGGGSWRAVSPDLTRHEVGREQLSGTPITQDNTSVEYYNVVFSIAASPKRDGEIWAGTDDGRVWLRRNYGARWSNVTPPSFADVSNQQWLRVDYVAPSPFEAGTAYVAADAHKWGDRAPHLFLTRDYGKTWTNINGNLPDSSYTRMIRPDLLRRHMLYAGTETALWYSYDDGEHWTQFANGLPTAAYYDFKIQPRFDDLVVGTHGRGIWILDDLHPLQEMTATVTATPLHLFTLRDAYRFNTSFGQSTSAVTGKNPDYGADINFFRNHTPASAAGVVVQILDGSRVIRTIDVKKPVLGVNRVWWDLSYDAIEPVKGFVPWASGGFDGPTAIPGTYTVRVRDGGTQVEGTVRVRIDPRSRATQSMLREQLAMMLRIRSDLSHLTATIENVQKIKAKGGPNAAKADDLLHRLYNPEVTENEDALRYPEQLCGQLSFLGSDVNSADAAPTASEYAVLQMLETQAEKLIAEAASLSK
ncbi:MAG: hypothetical protein M3R51_05280 [Candidatus Eremiobacteraeota bacterium]|nr:hypothetical protein [Candidatus Eremiobacteraeota bacterium]